VDTASLLAGDRRALARAITLVESTRADHREEADALLAALLPHTGRSIRVGVTGTPGVGKSTFIEAFGLHAIAAGHRVAVLAVDPSSRRGGGAILGDKTRMPDLTRNDRAFIRPSSSGGTLGGVARRTAEAVLVVEAAGFDVVLVETVGVGQSETAVADLTDLFLLLLQPHGGDELQGIKRGVMELADLLAVNKADGDNLARANASAADYSAALHLITPPDAPWQPPVVTCSGLTGTGLDEIWDHIVRHRAILEQAGLWERHRQGQQLRWMWSMVEERLLHRLFKVTRDLAARLEHDVLDGTVTAARAAEQLLAAFEHREDH
jgi:LAO/AO transport system kinase